MANVKITGLGAAADAKLTTAALVEVVDSDGVSKKATFAQLNTTVAKGILTKTFALSAAQVGALNTVPIATGIAAPGAGFWINVWFVPSSVATPSDATGRWGTAVFVGNPDGNYYVGQILVGSQLAGVPILLNSGAPVAIDTEDLENVAPEFYAFGDDIRKGGVNTAAVNAGGADYAPGDTVTIAGGNSAAELTIATVDGGGAVLTLTRTAKGEDYALATAAATTATTGIGTGLTVNTTVFLGGAVSGTIYYTIEPV